MSEVERSYSVSRIRRELQRYLAPALVEKVIEGLGERRGRGSTRPPTTEDHEDAARFLRRHGLG